PGGPRGDRGPVPRRSGGARGAGERGGGRADADRGADPRPVGESAPGTGERQPGPGQDRVPDAGRALLRRPVRHGGRGPAAVRADGGGGAGHGAARGGGAGEGSGVAGVTAVREVPDVQERVLAPRGA